MNFGIKIYRTDENGEICVEVNMGGIIDIVTKM